MKLYTSRLTVVAAMSALLGGCASTPAVRNLANQTGAFGASLDTGTSDFIARQQILNEQNAERLQQMAMAGDRDRANVRQLRLAWTSSGDTVRLATLDLAASRSADTIVAELEQKALNVPKIGGVPEGYSKSLKALAEIATGPKPIDQLRELIAFGEAVAKSYDDLRKKADDAAKAANASAEAADSATAAKGGEAANPQ